MSRTRTRSRGATIRGPGNLPSRALGAGRWTAPKLHHWAPRACIPRGPGKTNTPEDFTSLMNDLESKIFDRFDDAAVVHPGHGDDTTLGTERPQLAEWRKRGW